MSKDANRSTCKEDCVSACTDATCMEYCVSACTGVSTDNMGMHRSMCPYISTKYTDVHVVTSTKKPRVNTFLRIRMNKYD